MTYQPNIPQATDLISVSQDDILQNFQALDAAWNVNHEDFNSADQGKHKFLQIPEGAAPSTAISEGALYVKDNGGRSELFYRQENNGTEVQMTGIDPQAASSGYTFLPGGLLLQWGQYFPPGKINDQDTVTFPIAFSSVFSVTASPVRDGSSQTHPFYIKSLATTTVTGFRIRCSSNQFDGTFWMAIGTRA